MARVLIVGAGAAGLMAAGLEEKGCEVTYPQLQPFADKMEVVYEQYPQFSVWLDKIK